MSSWRFATLLPPLVFVMFLVTMSTRVLGESCFPLGASDSSGRGFNWHCASRRWQRHQKIAFVLVGSGSSMAFVGRGLHVTYRGDILTACLLAAMVSLLCTLSPPAARYRSVSLSPPCARFLQIPSPMRRRTRRHCACQCAVSPSPPPSCPLPLFKKKVLLPLRPPLPLLRRLLAHLSLSEQAAARRRTVVFS